MALNQHRDVSLQESTLVLNQFCSLLMTKKQLQSTYLHMCISPQDPSLRYWALKLTVRLLIKVYFMDPQNTAFAVERAEGDFRAQRRSWKDWRGGVIIPRVAGFNTVKFSGRNSENKFNDPKVTRTEASQHPGQRSHRRYWLAQPLF